MVSPKPLRHPAVCLQHKDDITGFNKERPQDGPIDMVGGDFRGPDLRELNADGVDFDAFVLLIYAIDFRIAAEGASSLCADSAYFPRS